MYPSASVSSSLFSVIKSSLVSEMGFILLYKAFSWPEIGSMEGKLDLFSDKLPFEGRLTLGTTAGGSSLPEPKPVALYW